MMIKPTKCDGDQTHINYSWKIGFFHYMCTRQGLVDSGWKKFITSTFYARAKTPQPGAGGKGCKGFFICIL